MENVLKNEFCEMSHADMVEVNGGYVGLPMGQVYLSYKIACLIAADLKNCYDIGYAEGKALMK